MKIQSRAYEASSRLRAGLLGLAAIGLLAALFAALARVGWSLPLVSGAYVGQHGALMVGGFLGALISLERAVALQRRWPYAVPLVAGLGGLALVLGAPAEVSRSLLSLAGLGLVAVFGLIYSLRPKLDSLVMALGAMAWLLGNLVWLAGWPMYRVAPWWMAFLILTIAGERLELSAVLRLTRRTTILFAIAMAAVLAGLLISLVWIDGGLRLTGLAFVGLGVWLLRYDVARRTARRTGLPRYVAVCLLLGYGWLAVGGLLLLAMGGLYVSGLTYDAVLHAVFLGFVMSMIFGHAPIIFPSVLRLPLAYRPAFYAPLALLHVSLAVRIAGDLIPSLSWLRWGGLFNVTAVLAFLGVVIASVARGMRGMRGTRGS